MKLRSDRRAEKRPETEDRRSFPRPPMKLNLLLLLIAVLGVGAAWMHRERVEDQYEDVLTEKLRTPQTVNEMKEQLAQTELTRESLEKELDGRMKFIQSLKSEKFYVSIDTEQKKLRFHYGDKILREGDIEVGQAAELKSGDKSWTFVPVKGSFPIEAKYADHTWKIPEWVYVLNKQEIPAQRPSIKHGLGRYVILLPNNYVIHSKPADASPLKGPKPGSFMASEADLRAIWPRISENMPVYIF